MTFAGFALWLVVGVACYGVVNVNISQILHGGMRCPVCGNDLRRKSYFDECWGSPMLVEWWHECRRCNTMVGESYGTTTFSICGGAEQFGYGYCSGKRARRVAVRRFLDACRRYRRRWKREVRHAA